MRPLCINCHMALQDEHMENFCEYYKGNLYTKNESEDFVFVSTQEKPIDCGIDNGPDDE